jgi:hypothetical protein
MAVALHLREQQLGCAPPKLGGGLANDGKTRTKNLRKLKVIE